MAEMADIKSPEERSRNMAKIRSKDTAPEEYFRKVLFRQGYRYRKNVNSVPGHPDAWMPKYNTAVFIHGCFWHRHEGCRYAYIPKSRTEFWENKFIRNIQRDQTVKRELSEDGIKCLIVWECTIRRMKKSKDIYDRVVMQVTAFLQSPQLYLEI